mgnify:CR=1 FL=1
MTRFTFLVALLAFFFFVFPPIIRTLGGATPPSLSWYITGTMSIISYLLGSLQRKLSFRQRKKRAIPRMSLQS